MKKRYYLLDEDGKQLASYARNQPGIEGLIKLDEAPGIDSIWDGEKWVENTNRNKGISIEKIDVLISTNIHKLSRRLKFDDILAIYDIFIEEINAATNESEIEAAEENIMRDLYAE
jgi:hypothetical protein